MWSAVIFLQWALTVSVVGAVRYSAPLDTQGRLQLQWEIRGERLWFELCGPSEQGRTRVMGFGLTARENFGKADLLLLWRTTRGWSHADCHTDRYGRPLPDNRQNYRLLGVERRGGRLCARAERKLVTCDPEDYQIDRGTTRVFAFVSSRSKALVTRLTTASMQRLQLIKSEGSKVPLPSDVQQIDLTLDKVHVPDAETTYWCRTLRLPPMSEKHHIVRYEGIISPQSVGIVHHMEVFHCEVRPGQKMRDYNAPCNSEMKPLGLEECRKVLGAWAMGATGISFPAEAGGPIGGAGFSRYVVIEVHFNNPHRKKGLVDSSGLRIFVTRQLRRFDAGLIELGLEYNAKNAVPPRQHGFTLSGHCTRGCTAEAVPRGGIKVFASQLHTHLTGRRVVTYHVRGNRVLADLNRDQHYSPHFQEIRTLPKPVTVLPGDALVTSCTYNTQERDNMTVGGLAISDEMCVNYIFYYPKIDLEVCKSSVADGVLKRFFREHGLKDDLADSSIRRNFNRIRWNKSQVSQLDAMYQEAPIHMSCNSSQGREINGFYPTEVAPTVLDVNELGGITVADRQCPYQLYDF